MLTPMTARLRAPAQLREARGRRLGAVVVESHPVDDGAVGDEPEEARTRVAVLRDRGQRADLDVAEAEGVQPRGAANVLVEAGRDAERRVEARVRARTSRAPAPGAVSARATHENGGTPSIRMTTIAAWWAVSGSMRERTVRKRSGYIPSRLSGRRARPGLSRRRTVPQPRHRGARVIGAQLVDRRLEVLERVEGLVDAREPQVRDLVELAQRAEDREADLVRVDLRRRRSGARSLRPSARAPRGRPR